MEYGCVSELIKKTVSPNLVEIEVMLTVKEGQDLDFMDWPGLEDVLSQTRFSSVRCTVDFRDVSPPYKQVKLDWDKLYHMVCERLPMLYSQGRLYKCSGRRWKSEWW
jgi:hypothetical protein